MIEAYDPDIALIFAEEAAELLEQAEGALGAWRAQPAQHEPLHALQRVLHTLKGGARMAGLMRTGTVSHDLETLLTNIASARMEASSDVFALLQHSFDRLHNVRERLTAGQPPGPLTGPHREHPQSVAAAGGGARDRRRRRHPRPWSPARKRLRSSSRSRPSGCAGGSGGGAGGGARIGRS